MPQVALPIIGQAYADEVLPLSAQECINWMYEPAESDGSRTRAALKGTPGLLAWATVGSGAIRAMANVAGVLYVVSGTNVYSVDSEGDATLLGTVPGGPRVQIANNIQTNVSNEVTGFQIVFLVGGYAPRYYDTSTSTYGTVSDPDVTWNSTHTVCYLDNYLVYDGHHRIFCSDLGDATAYTATNFENPYADSDDVVAVFADHQEVWVFGENSIEVFQNRGGSDFPFSVNQGAAIERGLGATYSVAKVDNSLMWVGDDGFVYRASGYTPQRVSTFAIDQDLADDFGDCFAFSYRDKGHWFYVLTAPNGKTWVYDAATGMWHRRKSYDMDRWRANCYVRAYDKHLVGDFESGKIFEMSTDVYQDDSEPMVAERKSQYVSKDNEVIFWPLIELICNTGIGPADLTTPYVELRYSDDGGRTWSNWDQQSIGTLGQYAIRARFRNKGRTVGARVFHIRMSTNCRRDLLGATARIELSEAA